MITVFFKFPQHLTTGRFADERAQINTLIRYILYYINKDIIVNDAHILHSVPTQQFTLLTILFTVKTRVQSCVAYLHVILICIYLNICLLANCTHHHLQKRYYIIVHTIIVYIIHYTYIIGTFVYCILCDIIINNLIISIGPFFPLLYYKFR